MPGTVRETEVTESRLWGDTREQRFWPTESSDEAGRGIAIDAIRLGP